MFGDFRAKLSLYVLAIYSTRIERELHFYEFCGTVMTGQKECYLARNEC